VGVARHQQDRTRPGGQRRLRDMAYDRLAIQFGYKLGFVWRPAETLRLAGGKDDGCNPPHLRHLLHRATSFAPRRDDFGNDRDADFGRTRGADGKPYGAMDLGELGLGKAGRAHPFEAPCVGYFGAERADIKAFRPQRRAERWVVDPWLMREHSNRRIAIKTHLPDHGRAWQIVAMSSAFAGNLTLFGSVANLIVAERAKQTGVTISFLAYGRIGLPLTLASLGFGYLIAKFGILSHLLGTSKNIRLWYDDRRSWSRHGQIVRSSASD
jgi:hypothetical protein